MPRRFLTLTRVSLASLMLWCAFVAPASSQGGKPAKPEEEDIAPPDTDRPRLRVGVLPDRFTLTGRLSDPAWAGVADSVTRLTTIEPREGEVPAARTSIKVLMNSRDIVIGARCLDPQARRIVSPSMARDAVLDEEDHLVFVLDTFMDGRSGFVFSVNASGARFDGLVTARGEEVNPNWDSIWEAKTSRDAEGWTAEIRISAKSLGFDPELTEWGFNVQRHVPSLLETSRWSGALRDFEVFQTSQAGMLTQVPQLDVGQGLSIRPALVARATRNAPASGTDYDEDASLDLSKTLGPGLLASLTVNTDFAETEVETRQLNLTRFPVFFPEKRSFFTAGADIFEFGLGLDEETVVPFFSRRIGLFGVTEEDRAAIPIDVGGKVSGRVGDTNLGALVVGTRKRDNLFLAEEDLTFNIPATTMGAFRVRQNVFEESSVGAIGTFGDQGGRSGSWMAGVDFTYQTSSFMGERNLLFGAWGLLNDRDGLQGDKSAHGFAFEFPNDDVDLTLTSIRLGDGFDPSLSFVARRGVHIWDLSTLLSHRPAWPRVRELTQELSFRAFNRLDNSTWASYQVAARPFDLLFDTGDRFEFALEPEGDRPDDTFSITDDADLPAGSYEWNRVLVAVRSAERRAVTGWGSVEAGSYYNGDLTTLEGGIGLKPSRFLTFEGTVERNTGEVTGVVEVGPRELPLKVRILEELFGLRVAVNVSPDLQFTSFTQYDTQSRELGSNNRLRWTFAPQGDLFVVYNHSLERGLDRRWRFQSNQLPVKVQYTWRF